MIQAKRRLPVVPKFVAAILAIAGLAAVPARAESVLRVAMTAGDIPDWTGQPDQGFEGYRFVGWSLYDALINWDLSRSDREEPTTALDASVQIQVLILLRNLQKEFGMGVIFVTHDLGLAAQIADKVAVMYAGRIVEYGNVRDVLMRPSHPYTLGMLASTIHGGQSRDAEIEAIPGSPPDMRRLPPGCAFAPRCRYAEPACTAAVPPPIAVAPGRLTCCIKAGHLTRPEPQSEFA